MRTSFRAHTKNKRLAADAFIVAPLDTTNVRKHQLEVCCLLETCLSGNSIVSNHLGYETAGRLLSSLLACGTTKAKCFFSEAYPFPSASIGMKDSIIVTKKEVFFPGHALK